MNESPVILLVEDSATQAVKFQHMLETEGLAVVVAPTAEAALNEINGTSFDLIVVDYHLPGIRGDELCRRIRMNVATRSLPVLILTIDDDRATELNGLESGADDFVSKSEDVEILLLRVCALLRKARQDGVVLDVARAAFRRPRILIADSDPDFHRPVAQDLADGGCEVVTAGSQDDAVRALEDDDFDCALIDAALFDPLGPRLGGTGMVVVAVLPAGRVPGTIARTLKAGADDFVGRDGDPRLTVARIKAHLRRRFLAEQNRRILEEFRAREVEALRARAELDAAEQAGRAKTLFFANMSHELRTPLNAILGFADLMRSMLAEGGGEERRFGPYIGNIHESASHLLAVVNDILDASRLESGKVTLHEGRVKIAEAVGSALRLVEHLAVTKNLALSCALPERIPDLWADGRLVKQVLLNILANAVKFTPEGGRVAMRAECKDNAIRLVVEDDGPGIAPADIACVLEPFGQAGGPETQGKTGTGLGLPLAKGFMELHGGALTLTSEVGKGTQVALSFPPERTRTR